MSSTETLIFLGELLKWIGVMGVGGLLSQFLNTHNARHTLRFNEKKEAYFGFLGSVMTMQEEETRRLAAKAAGRLDEYDGVENLRRLAQLHMWFSRVSLVAPTEIIHSAAEVLRTLIVEGEDEPPRKECWGHYRKLLGLMRRDLGIDTSPLVFPTQSKTIATQSDEPPAP